MTKLISLPRKLVLGGVTAATVLASFAAGAAPAAARPFHGGYGYHHGGGWVGPAIVGGLALGALASRPYWYGAPAGSCWLERREVLNRWGRPVIRRVEVCG